MKFSACGIEPCWKLLYAAGLRVSELLNLRPGDFDFQNLFLRVMGKGSKERLVPFHEMAYYTIREYVEKSRPRAMREKPWANHVCEP